MRAKVVFPLLDWELQSVGDMARRALACTNFSPGFVLVMSASWIMILFYHDALRWAGHISEIKTLRHRNLRFFFYSKRSVNSRQLSRGKGDHGRRYGNPSTLIGRFYPMEVCIKRWRRAERCGITVSWSKLALNRDLQSEIPQDRCAYC